jgi:hypothetical protein
MYNKYLLSDETNINEEDYNEREKLVKEFTAMPEDFFSKMRHFQPQIGCLNACKICSKTANARVEFWGERRIRNVIAALKYSSPQSNKDNSLITYDRYEHRNGVVFPYLDNDIGNYPYLDTFIKLAYKELGVTTRLSTVSYSRFNEELNEMHKKINLLDEEGLGGVRLSFTPYEIGWCSNNERYSKLDYTLDMANLLSIYKPYYNSCGAGSRKMCVEIRYKPLVEIDNVYETEVLDHKVICSGKYLFISKGQNVVMKESYIKDPFNHQIVLTEEVKKFYVIDIYEPFETMEHLKRTCHKFILGGMDIYELADIYLMSNYDGKYYAINPSITEDGNYGMCIYPKTNMREYSGYVITERFLVNAIIKYKKTKNLKSLEKFDCATWEDVYEVLEICKKDAVDYRANGKKEKYEYIIKDVLPMINAYISALQIAGYPANNFFDAEFSIDTGIICNLGRAINEFKGLTNKENEPLTPVHERNYGIHNSKMKEEGVSWRLSCNYNDSIVIEKLNMYDTASVRGQVAEKKVIQLNKLNEFYTSSDLKSMYLVPGERIK